MPLREIEKILANVVLLAGEGASMSLGSADLQAMFRDPGLQVQVSQPPGLPSQQFHITSLREQIVLVLNPAGQIIIEDKSANIPPKGRVADIVNDLVVLFAARGLSKFRAYGFNFHVSFDTPGERLAGEFLAQNFLQVERIQQKGAIQIGGAGLRLYFDFANATCDFRLEPRQNRPNEPKLFAAINYNYDVEESGLPTGEIIRSDFLGKWTTFQQLLEGLMLQQ